MPKRVIDLRSQVPLLDIVSYARGRGPLSPAQRAYIARTVGRVPEVVVKVSGGARTLAGVQRHVKYIERKGVFGLETDVNSRAEGPGFASDLVRDWDLDVEALKHYSKKNVKGKPPKLVHNIIFSMPAGTSPRRVLDAVRRLALNEWALQHRYALALHTDTPRPHAHVVLKAVSEQGIRMNIKKATLRAWRAQFAANLRELGVAANATERAVRGETRIQKRTEIYRAARRGDSTHMSRREADAIKIENAEVLDPGREALRRTRQNVKSAWLAVAAKLENEIDLQKKIKVFVKGMSPPRTDRDLLLEKFRRQQLPFQSNHRPKSR